MGGRFFARCMICLLFACFASYSYLDKQNQATALKIQLPKIAKEIEAIREENQNLRYQIECFEDPQHLLQLAASPKYSHLKYPFSQDVITVAHQIVVPENGSDDRLEQPKLKTSVVIGAK